MKRGSWKLGRLSAINPSTNTRSDGQSASHPGRISIGKRDWAIVFGILVASFLLHFATISNSGFFSDESVYSYAAYAIGKGAVPYVQIMLAHPPIGYISLVIPVIMAQGNVVLIRTYNLVLYLVIALISFWFYRALRMGSSASFGSLIPLALFSLYPTSFAATTPLEFTVFDIPVLLASVFFVTGITQESNRRLLVSGVFVGIALDMVSRRFLCHIAPRLSTRLSCGQKSKADSPVPSETAALLCCRCKLRSCNCPVGHGLMGSFPQLLYPDRDVRISTSKFRSHRAS